MRRKVILVKLGGSLITDKTKPFTARPRTIRRLARELVSFLDKSDKLVVLGHGGGSFPHTPAVEYKTKEGFKDERGKLGAAKVFDAAARLNRIVVGELVKAGIPAVGFPPSSLMLAREGKVHTFYLETILEAIKNGMLPVVYGDVIVDKVQGSSIFSTETILSLLAENLQKLGYKVEKIVHCGITEGVYDRDGKTIGRITGLNFSRLKSEITGSSGIDVTGGMLHKVEESLELARIGIPSLVINGNKKDELLRVLKGKPYKGTKIVFIR